jgi:hypothetical protein
MNTVIDALHEATHRVPGVPAHDELAARGGRAAHDHRARNPRRTGHRHPARHRHTVPPRVLVTWQNRIARLFRAGASRG